MVQHSHHSACRVHRALTVALCHDPRREPLTVLSCVKPQRPPQTTPQKEMSSHSSPPTLAVSGDVGVLAEENAQRLISIFMEAGMSCILNLRNVVEKELRSKGKDLASFQKFYNSGLASIGQWSSDMLQVEVSDIEAHYPETCKLHQFVFVSVLSEAVYSNSMANLVIPTVSDTYHAFLKRLVGNSDVQRGLHFLEMPLCHRRVVFLEAFRNAYHDMARKCASAQAEMTVSQAVAHRTSSLASLSNDAASERRTHRQKMSSGSTVTSEETKPTKSRLELAIMEAREATPTGSKAPSAASVAPTTSLIENTPEDKDSKDVLLLDSPAFFDEEKSTTPSRVAAPAD